MTHTNTATLLAAFGFFLVGTLLLMLAPQSASAAASPNASLGGGNALARATAGQSQGLVHASSTSNLLAHLTFASTRGGKPDEVPPAQSNAGGNGGNEEGSTDGGTDGSTGTEDSNTNEPSAQSNAGGNSTSGNNSNNGGASSGNGGNGGNASPGGLVVAGGVVSNAQSVNVLNTTIVRIGR